ncbi:Gfo/Idh/MocA family oxidoreductase [Mycobacterium cookii]|uniref:Gfo/Idh/MocA family oxidoreductase n=1 Tax=Nocardioides furvisabuli TaxID=375542 RepID=A0ABN2WZH5_9ACTN|nr:Gfo/Idh/MocA family oxidoreductase [Nocardioides furvisabuli]
MIRPLRVGVVGLGDIAQKAYLPVLAARDDVEVSLMTRDPGRLADVARRYGFARSTTRVEDLLDGTLDAAFVHASTDAHVGLVEQLLHAGVPVLVDKPLAPDLASATRLVELAEERGLSLAVGFNRRFCPAHVALSQEPASVVLVQKHRCGLPGEPRQFVLDDFIHVVDTVRFLMPAGEEEVSVWCTAQDGLLATVTIALRVGASTGLGVMHRVGGVAEEVVEVMGPGYQHRVVDLAEEWRAEAEGGLRLMRRDSWTDVPTLRGFTAMVDAFLGSVRSKDVISARDALRTHEICEQVVRAAEAELTR